MDRSPWASAGPLEDPRSRDPGGTSPGGQAALQDQAVVPEPQALLLPGKDQAVEPEPLSWDVIEARLGGHENYDPAQAGPEMIKVLGVVITTCHLTSTVFFPR